MDIPKLAREFEIRPDMLETALDGAAGLLCVFQENARPAEKKALRGVAKTLSRMNCRLSDNAVRERLVEAAIEEADGPDEDDLAYYIAWCAARARVDRAIDGAQDLLALVRAGETFKIPPGRPRYDHWTVAIGSLLEFWRRDLGREAKISAHPDDPREGKPSPVVRFVHQCMKFLDDRITEQACRTVLERLMADRGKTPGIASYIERDPQRP